MEVNRERGLHQRLTKIYIDNTGRHNDSVIGKTIRQGEIKAIHIRKPLLFYCNNGSNNEQVSGCYSTLSYATLCHNQLQHIL